MTRPTPPNLFFRYPLLIGLAVVALLLLGGGWASSRLIAHERQRDLNGWRTTLGVIADSRANSVAQWSDRQFALLNELGQNASLQLYTQQLASRSPAAAESEPAQLAYLRNLLLATAERGDFIDRRPNSTPINANLAFPADNGLALLNRDLQVIAATPGLAPLTPALGQAMRQTLASGQGRIVPAQLNENRQPVLGFLVPVHALAMGSASKEPIALLYGLKNLAPTLFPLLRESGNTVGGAETLLLQGEGGGFAYLTPLGDGTTPLQRRLPGNDATLAAAQAIGQPGGFGRGEDYNGREVLFTSRSFASLPWILLAKIDSQTALHESNRHQRFLLALLALALLLLSALLGAAWWHGSSLRAQASAEQLARQTRELAAQQALLLAIAEHGPDFIFLLDARDQLLLGNRALARSLDCPEEALVGKTAPSLFGPAAARELLGAIAQARQEKAPLHRELTLVLNQQGYRLHAVFVPTGEAGQLLVTLHDLSALYQAQEREAATMRQLLQALTGAIDLHDPYSARHSEKTALVARQLGQALKLGAEEQKALEVAAQLSNIGKLFIAKELLAKSTELSAGERNELQKEPLYAADVLKNIAFAGPVLAAISQKHEHLDGSGSPHRLQGEAIHPLARILAAANAFVAMISPRAYRQKLSVAAALAQLLAQSGSIYDRQVVAALFHVAENELDWGHWPDEGAGAQTSPGTQLTGLSRDS